MNTNTEQIIDNRDEIHSYSAPKERNRRGKCLV